VQAVEAVAGVLRNTRAVCRTSYIHPAIFEAHLDGSLTRAAARAGGGRGGLTMAAARGLRPDEVVVLALLKRLSRAAKGEIAA